MKRIIYIKDTKDKIFSTYYEKKFLGSKLVYPIDELVWVKYIQYTEFRTIRHWLAFNLNLDYYQNDDLTLYDTLDKDSKKLYIDKNYKTLVNGLYLQYSQNNDLKKYLLATRNNELVVLSKDDVLGIGYTKKVSRDKWGKNLLGKALMDIRTMLQKESN